MNIFVVTIVTLILSQLLVQICALDYHPVPELVRVRRRKDAGNAEFVALDFIGLVEEQGRRVEEHNVTTEDGYKLKVFRVPPHPNAIRKSGQRRVVFLQHGLAASSDYFVIYRPENSLVYILSDAGYDVWVGNVRGNTYGREHETLSPDQAAFWNFGLDEYGIKDLPAMIDYTISYTGEKKITYIGHSLGTTMVLMMLADRPEYVHKFDLVVHFAPEAYGITKSPVRRYTCLGIQMAQYLLDPWGTTEMFKQSSAIIALLTRFCVPNKIVPICWLPLGLLLGNDPEQMPYEYIERFFYYYPAGTSAKAFYQYRQYGQTGEFKRYDYENVKMNMQHYGRAKPPTYNLSHVNVPTVIFHAQNDPVSTVEDTKALISNLHPNTSIFYETVPYRNFAHLDFVTGKDVKKLLYNRLMQILNAFHRN